MAENQQQQSPPIMPTAPWPGSTTPGWNDPPPIHNNNATGRPRLNLNKRVAFPLSSDMNAKPTAIVQPNFNPANTNVAVVHPMPHAAPSATTMSAMPIAAAVAPPPVSNYAAYSAGVEHQQQQQLPLPHTNISNMNPNIPTMFVPALPRQTNESVESSSVAAPAFQSVQHL